MTKQRNNVAGGWVLTSTLLAAMVSPPASLSARSSTWRASTAGAIITSATVAASSRTERISSITLQNRDQPASNGGNSRSSSDPMSDIDDNDGRLEDWSAEASSDNYHGMPLISLTTVAGVTLWISESASIRAISVHSFYCLHEHLRERAPPRWG